MSSAEPTLNFDQATLQDLDFIVARTLKIHQFESKNSAAELKVRKDFSEQVEKWMSAELENSSSLIFTFSLSNTKAGFAFLKVLANPNEFTEYQKFGLIQSIWVEEALQKQNIGKQVVRFIESVFKEQNIPYYEVNYSSSNQLAEKFWSSCGLQVTSVTARKFLD